MTHLEQAVAYVKDNVDKYHVIATFNRAFREHSSLQAVDPALSYEIYDLMEEYGEDNDLPENWWLNEVDGEEDIFFAVVDLFNAEEQ